MPDAWVNINAASPLARDPDPICKTCDIRATVQAAKDKDRHCRLRRRAAAARMCHSVFGRVSGACAICDSIGERSRCRGADAAFHSCGCDRT
jgi:hypothetical protein